MAVQGAPGSLSLQLQKQAAGPKAVAASWWADDSVVALSSEGQLTLHQGSAPAQLLLPSVHAAPGDTQLLG